MEELIRDRIHEALELEPTPPSLRSRVMDSLPVAERRGTLQSPRLSVQWAAGLVAVLLALAIIAGFLSMKGLAVPAQHHAVPPVGLVSPEGIAIAPDGTVYVSDFLGDRIFRVRSDGKVALYAGGGTAGDGPAKKAWLNHPVGLAVDPGGNLFIADAPGNSIRRVDTRGNITTLAVRDESGATVRLVVPMGVAFDRSGALWVSEFYGTIRSIDPSGTSTTIDTSPLPPPNWVPGYIAFDAAGNLYVSDRAPGVSDNPLYQNPAGGGCRIVRIGPDKKLSVIAGTGVCGFSGDGGPAVAAQLSDPNGIAFDAAGNLYVSDANNHRIRRIDRNGNISTVAGTGIAGYSGDHGPANAAQLEFPFGMGITPSGLLYFSDMTCQCWNPSVPGRLRVVNLSTGVVTTVMDGQTPIIT